MPGSVIITSSRDGSILYLSKGGVVPSSAVNTDLKFSLNAFEISAESEVQMLSITKVLASECLGVILRQNLDGDSLIMLLKRTL